MTTRLERANARHAAYRAKLGSLQDVMHRLPWGWDFQSTLIGDRMFVQLENITGVILKGYLPEMEDHVESLITKGLSDQAYFRGEPPREIQDNR